MYIDWRLSQGRTAEKRFMQAPAARSHKRQYSPRKAKGRIEDGAILLVAF